MQKGNLLLRCTAGRNVQLLGVVETQPQPLRASPSAQRRKRAEIANPGAFGRGAARLQGAGGDLPTPSSLSGPGAVGGFTRFCFLQFFSLRFQTWRLRGLEGRGGGLVAMGKLQPRSLCQVPREI